MPYFACLTGWFFLQVVDAARGFFCSMQVVFAGVGL